MAEILSETTRTRMDYRAAKVQTPNTKDSPAPVAKGFRAWLPALVILVGLPLLALVAAKYILLPSMKRAFAEADAVTRQSDAGQGTASVFIARIPFNLIKTGSAHSGFRSFALVGSDSGFQATVKQNKTRLMEIATADLKGVTTADLDQPGALNAMRARLQTDFNHALGASAVKEVYIAEWPR